MISSRDKDLIFMNQFSFTTSFCNFSDVPEDLRNNMDRTGPDMTLKGLKYDTKQTYFKSIVILNACILNINIYQIVTRV